MWSGTGGRGTGGRGTGGRVQVVGYRWSEDLRGLFGNCSRPIYESNPP